MFEIYLNSTKKTSERRQWGLSGVFIVDFEQLNASWVGGTQTSECIPKTLSEEVSFGGQRSYV